MEIFSRMIQTLIPSIIRGFEISQYEGQGSLNLLSILDILPAANFGCF